MGRTAGSTNKKTTTTETKKTTEPKKVESKVEDVVEEKETTVDSQVQDMILAMQKQMKEMQDKLDAKEKEKSELSELVKVLKESKSDEKEEGLTSDTYIKVISQYVGKLTLFTQGKGRGEKYEFEGYGEVQDIPYGDLKEIVKNQRSFAQIPYFYIANEEAVDACRLKQYYKRALSNEDMMTLLEKDENTIIELYKLAPDRQKEVIVDYVIDNKEKMSYNVLMLLGKECGKELVK